MAVPSDAPSRRLIGYFHDCLEGEFARQDPGDSFAKGQHHLQGFVTDSGLGHLTGASGDPVLRFRDTDLLFNAEEIQQLFSRYQLVQQDYQLMVGIMGVREYVHADRSSCSPLFLAPIQNFALPKPDDALVNIRDLLGNTALIDRFSPLAEVSLPLDRKQWAWLRYRFAMESPPWIMDDYGIVQVWLWLNRRSRLDGSVLHELRELSSSISELADPVATLLGRRRARNNKSAKSTPELLPTSLTKPQEEAVLNGARFPLSVINGPPGTGKTHTIACQVMDAVINQRSTLIVCSNDQSADVVRDKITAMLAGSEQVVLRPGRGDYKQELVDRISQWLDGEYKPEHDEASLDRVKTSLEESSRHYHQAEERFFRGIADAERSTDRSGGPLDFIRSWWSDVRTSRSPLLTEHWRALQSAIAEHQECMSRFLHQQLAYRLNQLLSDHRKALATLSKALRSRASHTRNERFEALDWSVVTRVFPVWVVSAGDLSDSVPMTTELFDLVIVDEATQCNLPQALPALQRGKRAVIVGDPKQLRHYSFLARKIQDEAALKHELNDAPVDLDYRSRSLLDYAIDALPDRSALSFLDEHFRSNPVLIDFSNERFYNNRIKILTAHRQNAVDKPLHTVACTVDEKSNINQGEVERVMSTLHALVRQYQDALAPPSIGVLGMVRATALRLEDRITREISLDDISRHQLRVGTPYAFQGDERDIMLIASCAWPGQAHGTQRYLDREDVFNVAVTRARQRQIFFYGEGLPEAEPGMLASRYALHGANRQQQEDRLASSERAEDPVLEELSRWFAQRGLPTRHNLQFAGQPVELAADVDEHLVAIDLVGRTHGNCDVGKAWDAARYRLLERAGLVLAPVARQHWLGRRDEVLADLEQQLALGESAPPLHQGGSTRLYQRLKECGTVADGGELPLAEVYDQLHRAGDLVEFWLKQHFQPGELTYQRYQQARRTLIQQAERKLEGVCLILESFRGLGAPEEMQDSIRHRLTECHQAVEALKNLGAELAELSPSGSDMDAAMEELQRLTKRVSDYKVN